MQLRELYKRGKNLLEQSLVPEPAIEASSLLSSAIGLEKLAIYTYPEMKIDEESVLKFNDYIKRRINGEPNSYITGSREFYSKRFFVNKDVLIPRPETELVVEEALKIIPDNREYLLADICSGSGCIGVAICSIKESVNLISADLSFPAARIAQRNSKLHLVNGRSLFVNTCFLDCIKNSSVDMVVCNPPYIASEDYSYLQAEIKNFEPRQALVSGEDGLTHIKEIITSSKKILKNGGWIIIEVGSDQGRRVGELFKLNGYHHIDVIPDINNIDRVIKAQWNES